MVSEQTLAQIRFKYRCSGMRKVRLEFLLEAAPEAAAAMAADGTLDEHLTECSKRYAARVGELQQALMKQRGIDSEMNGRDPGGYIRAVNMATRDAMEIARREVIEAL